MATETLTPREALERIQHDHEAVINDEPQKFSEAASAGDVFRQGDLYIWKRDEVPQNARLQDEVKLQLVPGESKGSRHILDSAEGVELFHASDANALQGPWLRFTQERVITHPQHGNVICPPGVYEITYQRAMSQELKRVRD